MVNKSEYLEKLTADYLPAFLAFAVKNINNLHEAEEFAQETAYQCVLAINKPGNITNFNAFVWSIVHNTYKRWCARKKYISLDDDGIFNTLSNIMSDDAPIDFEIIQEEERTRIYLEISRLTDLYRRTLVCFYYEDLSIAKTSEKLGISVEMVKFYLQKCRQKLKEACAMPNDGIGKKSFNPSEFSVYKSAIDFSKVNVWEVFKRKLPCQTALICHDSEKSVSEISINTGVPAVYIEEELGLLIDAGVMISPVHGKYRTNLFILKKDVLPQVKEQFSKLYEEYLPSVTASYEKNLPELKKQGIFKQDVPDSRYAWFFAGKAAAFDFNGYELTNDDYPQILSCGSRGFIFAEEATGSPWAAGVSMVALEKCSVYPKDIVIFGEYHCQRELCNERKAQALYDVYTGQTKDGDIEIYAQLIEEGYVVKNGSALFCNVAVSTPDARKLFDKINADLEKKLSPLCKVIRENMCKIVKSTIPPQLKNYTKGYVETLLRFYSDLYFYEALYNKDFINIPEKGDKTPVACWIYEIFIVADCNLFSHLLKSCRENDSSTKKLQPIIAIL
ncbi:MAG: sigma-70 family RNA polymerase sigma factor [Clostridiales bacterium]|jgi:RNA polymerase sigma factor (sigma-70 family)|nr:sigma-70 family RNA polymerase sigma factor [Clostridiales bacterium]